MSLTIGFSPQPSVKKRSLARKRGVMNAGIAVLILKVAMPLVIIFAIYSLTAFINSKINMMAKTKDAIRSEIDGLEKEIENVNLKIQKARGGNINKQINRFKLGLRLPQWGQLKDSEKLTVVYSKELRKNLVSHQSKASGKNGL
jgi:peptidoglycan hydrolase CwlO-like protein